MGRNDQRTSRRGVRRGVASGLEEKTRCGHRKQSAANRRREKVLTQYVEKAMAQAHYEIMENGRYWGEVPALRGVWAEGETLEQCRQTLREVLEDWLLVGLRLGHTIPVIEGIDLNRKAEAGTVAD